MKILVEKLKGQLMWMARISADETFLCARGPNRGEGELQGWPGLEQVRTLIPELLNFLCPGAAGNIVIRSKDAVYLVFCLCAGTCLVLGLEPSTSLNEMEELTNAYG